MRVQTKLMLSTFPILFGGFVLLALLSFYTAQQMMRADGYRYIDAVLGSRIDHTLERRAELLRRSKMDKVASFVALYKQEALAELAIGSDSKYGCFAVFDDKNSKVFASTGCTGTGLLSVLRQSARQAAAAPERGSKGLIDDHPQRLFGARYFAPWGWSLVYSTEASRLEQASNRILTVTFAVASLCVAACALVVVVVFRRVFGKPVLRLKTAAARIASREPNVRIEVRSTDELGDLSGSLNEMAAAISDYIRKLEDAHDKLRKSEESLSRAVSSGNVGLWDWDLRTDRAEFSWIWKRQLGYEEHELTPCYEEWESRLHPADADAAVAALQASCKPPWPPYEREFRLRHKDGSYRSILATGGLERDAEGQPLRMRGVHIDITERKRAEEERSKLEAQLHQAQKMESVGRLAGGVAHDFNNLLGVILMRSELVLMEKNLSGSLKSSVDEIMKAAERSAELTKQLLAFARKQTIVPKVLDLNDTVAGTLTLLQRLIRENISLTFTKAPNLWSVRMDPSQVGQILTNLCVNARDAITDVGKILIETSNLRCDRAYCATHAGSVPGDYVQLAVSDNGYGMDAQTQAHMFEPFFTTKGVGKGSGLGLATVHGIVEQNRGFITVHSEPGRGTRLEINLPRCLDSVEPVQAPLERVPLRGRETILLVEDEVSLLTATAEMLERLGYTVLPASSAAEALRVAETHAEEIQLLLTDVVMPEMDGTALAEHLTTLYPRLRCVFMSGYATDVLDNHHMAEHVHYIEKPLDIQRLSLMLREALG